MNCFLSKTQKGLSLKKALFYRRGGRIRTDDPQHPMLVRYQLRYTPNFSVVRYPPRRTLHPDWQNCLLVFPVTSGKAIRQRECKCINFPFSPNTYLLRLFGPGNVFAVQSFRSFARP
jgi:hypothetical protein